MLNKAASAPAEIVTVADSETFIVAALAEVAMFSDAEKDEEEVKVGAVLSEIEKVKTTDPLVLFVYFEKSAFVLEVPLFQKVHPEPQSALISVKIEFQ
jgi:hypothetical protein